MKIAAPICALLFLFAYSVRAEDAESKNERDPWNGFGIGSWVIQVKSFTKGTETTTQREKQTRTEAEKAGQIQLSVREEGKTSGVFDGKESIRWHIPGYDPALDPKSKLLETKKEELTIQGKKYACEVKKYDLSRGEDKTIVSYWRCTDVNVPYREEGLEPLTLALRSDVLRLDADYTGKEQSEKTSFRVVNLREEHKIGKQTIICTREEGTFEVSKDGKKGKATGFMLRSHNVPGREVESSAEGEFGGIKYKKEMRIEDFEVVK